MHSATQFSPTTAYIWLSKPGRKFFALHRQLRLSQYYHRVLCFNQRKTKVLKSAVSTDCAIAFNKFAINLLKANLCRQTVDITTYVVTPAMDLLKKFAIPELYPHTYHNAIIAFISEFSFVTPSERFRFVSVVSPHLTVCLR